MIKRLLVAGGGTGGHLFPGIAVVEEMRRRQPGLDVTFVGTKKGIEARIIPARGERLELLEVTPLKGRKPLELLRSFGRLPGAMGRAGSLLRSLSPDLVLGVGGYASGPILAAAAAMRIPTALLEQNAHVGLTNRLLSPLVGRAYLSYAGTAQVFRGERARVVGNPVRRDFVRAAHRAMADPEGFEARARTLLVIGGSQGAGCLNREVPEALAAADVVGAGFRILHQTGEAMRAEVEARYRELGIEAEVVPFLDDMASAFVNAALVIARAGATTLAELCAIGRPSILIPYPHAADDHQARNAEELEHAGAAIAIRESALTVDGLAERVKELLASAPRRRAMSEAARGQGRPDAAASIVDDLCEWLGCPPQEVLPEAPETNRSGGGGGRGLRMSSGREPYLPVFGHHAALGAAMRSRRPLVLDGRPWE